MPKPRVEKCHGYDGLIRVKILASWSKILGESEILQNQGFRWEILCQNHTAQFNLHIHLISLGQLFITIIEDGEQNIARIANAVQCHN